MGIEVKKHHIKLVLKRSHRNGNCSAVSGEPGISPPREAQRPKNAPVYRAPEVSVEEAGLSNPMPT
jgi:hypothetical protein